jgi:hypothetical protein
MTLDPCGYGSAYDSLDEAQIPVMAKLLFIHEDPFY